MLRGLILLAALVPWGAGAGAGAGAAAAGSSARPSAVPLDGPVTSAGTRTYARACPALSASDYYVIRLVPTRQVTGTGRAEGVARASFASTPFGIAVAADGSYRSTLHVQVDHLPARAPGRFVAWATTPEIDAFARIGELDADGYVEGPVEWNKFLVVVTLEPEGAADPGAGGGTGAADGAGAGAGAETGAEASAGAGAARAPGAAPAPAPAPAQEMWSGPIVLRGMSRSGMMHTMAGHGPFEQQECAAFGY